MLTKDVLSYLEENRGISVTGGQIARRLGVSRTAIWKAVRALKEKGHEITSAERSGYRLESTSDGLSEQAVAAALTTEKFGRMIEFHDSLASTNTYMKELNSADYPEGFTVVADEQTNGKGRFGRVFQSPAGQGMYLSVLVKPDIALSEVSMLTIGAAVAVCRAVGRVYGVSAGIKWVNDVFVGGKKLCGILSEASVSAELQQIESVVVGIGINTGTVDSSVKDIAVSVSEESGRRGLRNRLIAEVLNQLEDVYLRSEKSDILAAYSEKMLLIDKRVEVKESSGSYSATVLGVDGTGALSVRLPNGETRRIIFGEIMTIDN